jgi:hypothetical protein
MKYHELDLHVTETETDYLHNVFIQDRFKSEVIYRTYKNIYCRYSTLAATEEARLSV